MSDTSQDLQPTNSIPQPVTDDTIKVRQITHYQFTWVAGEANEPGTHIVQLVLDQGAWEEVLTLNPIDSLALQVKLATTSAAFYDVKTRTVSTANAPVGAGLLLAAAAAS